MKVHIVCYEDVHGWILGKFARKLQEHLLPLGVAATIAKQPDPRADINHHIIYFDYDGRKTTTETVMVTHIDMDWKRDRLRQQLVNAAMGICCSAESVDQLAAAGLPREKLCFVNPGHDGEMRARRTVVGITSKVQPSGCKREGLLLELASRLSPEEFQFRIMGAGWDDHVRQLRRDGFTVEYWPAFDRPEYLKLMPSLDYYLYLGLDEGSMGFMDALAAGVQTIVTTQGYHLDAPGGITHGFSDASELRRIFESIAREKRLRQQAVANWTWPEFSRRHFALWQYLLARQTGTAFPVALCSTLDRMAVFRDEAPPVGAPEAVVRGPQASTPTNGDGVSTSPAQPAAPPHPGDDSGCDATTRVTRNGVTFALDLAESIDRSLHDEGCFEPTTTAVLAQFARPGMTVLDIGANIGAHTFHLAQHVGPTGRVLAFEPMSGAFNKLRRTAGLNPALTNLTLNHMALGAENGALQADFNHSWPVDGNYRDVTPEPVPVRRLDDFLAEQGIARVDLIKLDVDGFEHKILRGAARTLRESRPLLVMELCNYTLERVGDSVAAMLDDLAAVGYRFFFEHRPQGPDVAKAELLQAIPAGSSINIVAAPIPGESEAAAPDGARIQEASAGRPGGGSSVPAAVPSAPRAAQGSSRPRILLIADVPNWIFERHARTLSTLLNKEFDFTLCFLGTTFDEDDYDLIYPLEWTLAPQHLIRNPRKWIAGIRSHCSWAKVPFNALAAHLSRNFQGVHVVSQRLLRHFAPHVPGVVCISHGVDTRHFTPTTRADQSGRRLRLGWAGNRTSVTKGFKEFVEPLGQLPGVELVFCGYNDRNLSLDQMRDFYDSIDAYVCASGFEGNNNSLLEAASMERAIITTDNGTVPEYLRHGENALIVERELPNFVRAVQELRDDPAIRVALGAKARVAVQRQFDWLEMVRLYAAFFNSALAASQSAGTEAMRSKSATKALTGSASSPSANPLRITYLINSILGVTGGNQTLLGHVNGLVARGHDVAIVTCTPKPPHTPIAARVIQVPAGGRMADCVPESDVVVATYFINAVELASIKAPVKVYYAQGDQYVFADTALKGGQHEQLRKLSDLSYQMEDVFFLPNSANLAQAVRARTRRLPDAVLPVMVNRAVFKPTPRDNTPETWRILIVGPDSRGSESEPLTFKGIGDIREALRLLGQRTPNFQVLRMSSTSPDLFADFPCEFHQAPPSALKTRLYGSADILIYASHYDSCPRPPLEAMSAGCALVCTDTAGAREYCQDGVNCRLVPIKSPQAIADAVWEIMTTATLRQRIVQGGFTTAERLDERQEIDVLEKLLLQFRSDALAGKRAVGFEKQTAKRLPPRMPASITLPRVAQIGQLTKAQELWRKKSPRLAWEATRDAIQIRPHHPEAFLLLAEIARMVGDSADARSCAQHALRLAPAFKPARKFLQGRFHGKTKPDWLVLPNPIGDSNGAKRIRLSVCLIVKNEERFLDQCLASVRDVADQIVVVDTGSTDRTIEIARTHGAEVHSFAWCDDFSAARNAALEHATGEWVLALDADEELPPSQHDALRRMLDRASIMGWRLPLVDVGREENGHHYVPRLFRNAPGLFYVGRVHEQVFYSVEARRKEWGLENELGDALLRHHGYTEEVMKERGKVERNLRLLEVAVTEITDDPMLVMNYGLELIRSGRFDAGLHQYRAAFEMMSKLPASAVVLDSREALLTHFCTHLHTAKRPLEVLSVLSSPLARNGGLTASLHYLLGVAHMELQQFADAAQQLRHCLAQRARPTLTPANREVRKVTPRHYLARCLWLAQELDEAEREFEVAITEAPEAVNVQIDYARCLHEHGKTADALQILNRCTTANAGLAAAWVAGGQIALSQPGLLEVATDWTQVAIAHHPDDVTLSAQRAEALMLSGQLEAALPCWIKVEDATGARAIAARILCEIVVGADVIAPPPATLSAAVSREFGRWYWQLVEYGAESAVVQLHAHVGELGQVLPDAAEVLRSVIDRLAVAEAV